MATPPPPLQIDTSFLGKYPQLGRGTMPSVQGLVVHHTGADTSVQSIINGWMGGTYNNKPDPGATGAQFIMDRSGTIYQTVPDGTITNQVLPSWNPAIPWANNSTTMGIELMAKDNSDVTPQQVQALQQFALQEAAEYGFDPATHVVGHGEINGDGAPPGTPGTELRQPSEGMAGVDALRSALAADPGLAQGLAYSGAPFPATPSAAVQAISNAGGSASTVPVFAKVISGGGNDPLVVQGTDGQTYTVSGDQNFKYNNPTAMQYDQFAIDHGAIGSSSRPGQTPLAVFPTMAAGQAAAQQRLFGDNSKYSIPDYKDMTLEQAIKSWAPAGVDGNQSPTSYINGIAQSLGISANTKLSDLSAAQQAQFIAAQQHQEGQNPQVITDSQGNVVASGTQSAAIPASVNPSGYPSLPVNIPVPSASAAAAPVNTPLPPGYGASGLTEAQRNAMLAVPSPSAAQQTVQIGNGAYNVGQTYKTADGASFTANANGTFTKTANTPHAMTPIQLALIAAQPGAMQNLNKTVNGVKSLAGQAQGALGTAGSFLGGLFSGQRAAPATTPAGYNPTTEDQRNALLAMPTSAPLASLASHGTDASAPTAPLNYRLPAVIPPVMTPQSNAGDNLAFNPTILPFTPNLNSSGAYNGPSFDAGLNSSGQVVPYATPASAANFSTPINSSGSPDDRSSQPLPTILDYQTPPPSTPPPTTTSHGTNSFGSTWAMNYPTPAPPINVSGSPDDRNSASPTAYVAAPVSAPQTVSKQVAVANPAYAAWLQNNQSAIYGVQGVDTPSLDANGNVVLPSSYLGAPAPKIPAPPKTVMGTIQVQSSVPAAVRAPSAPMPTPVQLASGAMANVGQTFNPNSSGGGYTYRVNADGSTTNLTTGHTYGGNGTAQSGSAPYVTPPLASTVPGYAAATPASSPDFWQNLENGAGNAASNVWNGVPAVRLFNGIRSLFPGQAPSVTPPSQGGLLGGLFSGLMSQPYATPGAITAQLTPQVVANQNPLALAALRQGQSAYTAPGGGMVPTIAMNGNVRNSYGDAANGLGGSLVGGTF